MQSILIRLPGVAANGQRPLILGPPPPDPWTPAELSDLRGWWVPHTLGLTVGAAIASLPSSAGISNTAAQATGSRQPLYALLNGKGAANLDGADDALAMSDLSVTNDAPAVTFFALFKLDAIDTDAAFKNILSVNTSGSGSSTRASLVLSNTASAAKPYAIVYRRTDGGSTTVVPSATVASTAAPHLVIATINYASPKIDIWLDGANILNTTPAYAAGNFDATNAASAYLGARGSTPGQSIDGQLSQAGIIPAALTLSDRQKLEGYLAHYGGIQASLPVDHPYKSAPPTL